MKDHDPYSEAVAAIYAAVRDDAPLSRDDVVVVRRYLAGALRPASARVVEEAVGDALERFVVAVKEGRVRAGTAAAYLRRIASNRLVDLQRRQRETPSERVDVPLASSDDDIARLLDTEADAALVTAGLAAAVTSGDDETVRIVVLWLDEADRRKARPSSRDVADLAGVSHTRVLQALRDFGRYLRGAGG